MELKINYQYTYFIYPFTLKNGKYEEYIKKMLEDKRFQFKVFKKEKDLKMYRYFLPKTRDLLFPTFKFSKEKMRDLEGMETTKKSKELSKLSCNIFEYNMEKNIQGKVDFEKGIFFNISKVEVICFKTGESFLVIRTIIEDDSKFSNILNFNYKFRNINQEVSKLNGYDNIRLQTSNFSDVATFREFIKDITDENIEKEELDINTERFLTYSYVCIDQDAWNADTEFSSINHQFIRYANVLPADNSRDLKEEDINIVSKWKYAKIGMTKQSVALFSSNIDINNYTILPEEYQNQYFYTYVLNLYKKMYLKKIQTGFNDRNSVKIARKQFVDFTKKLWNQEITEDQIGTTINQKIVETIELENIYENVKNKYDIVYKDENIEKNERNNIIIIAVLIITFILNIINLFLLK